VTYTPYSDIEQYHIYPMSQFLIKLSFIFLS